MLDSAKPTYVNAWLYVTGFITDLETQASRVEELEKEVEDPKKEKVTNVRILYEVEEKYNNMFTYVSSRP